MDDGDVIGQIGLLLTQLRYARRALEDIERNTARYVSLGVGSAFVTGGGFGAPPMLSGALKVYVTNLGDLTAGSGSGGFLEGLLGGIGRLFGGFIGGIAGGTAGAAVLPFMIGKIENIALAVERILDRIGVKDEPPKTTPSQAVATPPTAAAPTASILDTIKDIAKTFTALFEAASGNTEAASATHASLSPEAKGIVANLQSAEALVRGVIEVVKGLTILIPEAIGAIALLFSRLDSIKLAVVQMLQFILREALLLRGVALAVIFDTLAAAATLAANVLGIVAVTVDSAIKSVFGIFGNLFDAALAAIEFLSNGLQRTINALLKWLVESLVTTLNAMGQTTLVRVAVYAFQLLPYILPALIELKGESLGQVDRDALDQAKTLEVAEPPDPGKAATSLPSFPNISEALVDPKGFNVFKDSIDKSLTTATSLTNSIFDDSEKGIRKIATRLDAAATDGAFNAKLDAHLGALRERSKTLADSLNEAQAKAQAAADHPATGLEAIAAAYEKWLASPDGLTSVLGKITSFLGKEGADNAAVAQRVLEPSDRSQVARATVEIGSVVIELAPPAEAPKAAARGPLAQAAEIDPELLLSNMLEVMHDARERGLTFGPGSPFLQV